MKVLVLAAYPPWPLHAGNNVRLFHLLQGLADAGHDVTLLAGNDGSAGVSVGPLASKLRDARTYDTGRRGGATAALAGWLRGLPYPFARFVTPSLRTELAKVLGEARFDVLLVNLVPLAAALPAPTEQGPLVVLDEGESQEALWAGFRLHGTLPHRIFARLNLPFVRRADRRALARAHGILCVSREELALRRADGPTVACAYVPNGVDLQRFRPPSAPREGQTILFLGNLSIRRNASAILWFADHVFPRVRLAQSGARLRIVGRRPRPEVSALARRPGIEVVPDVEDVRPEYARATVGVLPYWLGAGTKLKALEAMAMGLPQVSTPAGVLGLEAESGRHVVIADTPDAFADACVQLLKDPSLARRIGREARALSERRYAWPRIVAELEQVLDQWRSRRTIVELAP